jgi:hypothetical protein
LAEYVLRSVLLIRRAGRLPKTRSKENVASEVIVEGIEHTSEEESNNVISDIIDNKSVVNKNKQKQSNFVADGNEIFKPSEPCVFNDLNQCANSVITSL